MIKPKVSTASQEWYLKYRLPTVFSAPFAFIVASLAFSIGENTNEFISTSSCNGNKAKHTFALCRLLRFVLVLRLPLSPLTMAVIKRVYLSSGYISGIDSVIHVC